MFILVFLTAIFSILSSLGLGWLSVPLLIVLVVVGLIVIVIIKLFLVLIPAIIIAAIVYFVTGEDAEPKQVFLKAWLQTYRSRAFISLLYLVVGSWIIQAL
jgi:hypothetical protein